MSLVKYGVSTAENTWGRDGMNSSTLFKPNLGELDDEDNQLPFEIEDDPIPQPQEANDDQDDQIEWIVNDDHNERTPSPPINYEEITLDDILNDLARENGSFPNPWLPENPRRENNFRYGEIIDLEDDSSEEDGDEDMDGFARESDFDEDDEDADDDENEQNPLDGPIEF